MLLTSISSSNLESLTDKYLCGKISSQFKVDGEEPAGPKDYNYAFKEWSYKK